MGKKIRMILVEGCGCCPCCTVDDYEWSTDKMEITKLTLKCTRLNRRIRNEEGFLRDCPLKKYDGEV